MKKFENYPSSIIATTILFQLAIYFIGGYIIFHFNLALFFLYLAYLVVLEITFYPKSCVYCYYYGKWCAFGKGKVAGWFFEKKESERFCEREASFIKMIPEMLVVLVPIILGIVVLIQNFSLVILVLIVLDIILLTYGNSYVRSKLTCPHCKQGEICCPARAMFNK